MKRISDLMIKYVNIRPKLRGGSDKQRDNESMEKYLINYKKKEAVKNQKYIVKESLMLRTKLM